MEYTIPYPQIDFSKMGREDLYGYMDRYFDDVLKMLKANEYDIIAHLTCPLRYIEGRYGIKIEISYFEKRYILQCTIE